MVPDELCLTFYELGEWSSEKFLFSFSFGEIIDSIEDIAGFRSGSGEGDLIVLFAFEPTVVGVGIAHFGHEMAVEAKSYSRVKSHY